jgi:hypothetical protein
MLYMAGDNDLDEFGVADLNEAKKAGSTSQVNLVAQFDRQGRLGTKRYYLRKGTSLGDDVVETLGETNTGDPNVLKAFVEWAATKYPAKKFMLILWNHGAGWDDTNVYRAVEGSRRAVYRGDQVLAGASRSTQAIPSSQVRAATAGAFRRSFFSTTMITALGRRAILFDDGARDMLDNLEMKRVLKEITGKILHRKLDILAMDACLMNMVEVNTQVQDMAEVLIASEESEPGEGWPYDAVLVRLIKSPTVTSEQFAKAVVNKYLQSYSPSDEVTQAAVRLTSLQEVVSAVDALASHLKIALADPAGKMAIMEARAAVQSFKIYNSSCYIDLYDFCDLLAAKMADPVRSACQTTKRAIQGAIIDAGSKGRTVAAAHGISIYFPLTSVSNLYGTLDFAKATAWPDFLEAYLHATRARPRALRRGVGA